MVGGLLVDLYQNSKDKPEDKTAQMLKPLQEYEKMDEQTLKRVFNELQSNKDEILKNRIYLKEIVSDTKSIKSGLKKIKSDTKSIKSGLESVDSKTDQIKRQLEQIEKNSKISDRDALNEIKRQLEQIERDSKTGNSDTQESVKKLLDELRNSKTPTMPQTCPSGQTLQNGQCVAITCPSGQTLQNGQCRSGRRQEPRRGLPPRRDVAAGRASPSS